MPPHKPAIALIGSSSPLCYEYTLDWQQELGGHPVLEAPTALIALFDEIWFLHESLCPANMRDLPYVRFLNRRPVLPGGANFSRDILPLEAARLEEFETLLRSAHGGVPDSNVFERYNEIAERARGLPIGRGTGMAALDNHNGSARIGDVLIAGNSVRFSSLALDNLIEDALAARGFDVRLVTNTLSHRLLPRFDYEGSALSVAETLIVRRIPNHNGARGPYHPCLEELRESKFIAEFRNKVRSEAAALDGGERADVVARLESEFRTFTTQAFRKYVTENPYSSAARDTALTATETVASTIPGVAPVITVLRELGKYVGASRVNAERVRQRWAGLLVDASEVGCTNATG